MQIIVSQTVCNDQSNSKLHLDRWHNGSDHSRPKAGVSPRSVFLPSDMTAELAQGQIKPTNCSSLLSGSWPSLGGDEAEGWNFSVLQLSASTLIEMPCNTASLQPMLLLVGGDAPATSLDQSTAGVGSQAAQAEGRQSDASLGPLLLFIHPLSCLKK